VARTRFPLEYRLGRHLCYSVTLLAACAAVPATTIKIPPAASYLRANGETPANAVPIALSGLGVVPGDFVQIQRLGDFKPGASYDDASVGMTALFSSNATLLAAGQAQRVPGALEAGADVVTPRTYFGSMDTDIPQDFLVTDGAIVIVPSGASHLFAAAWDSAYADNSDPDNDYAVSITKVSARDAVAAALAVWGGLVKPSPTTALTLDAVPAPAPPPVVNLLDAVRLARRASGLDP
jgi:hypothetical protein